MNHQNSPAAKSTITLLISLIIVLRSLPCMSQGNPPTDKEWNDILAQHSKGTLHDTLYLLEAQALTEKWFKDPRLKAKLSMYRKIAWSNTAYRPFRVKYYAFLANNAALVHDEGHAIYYLQKMEEELTEIKPYLNTLNQPRLLLSVYGSNNSINQDKRIAIIDSVMPFLKSLPSKLSEQPVSINTCINAFTILKHASQLHLARKDTLRVLETMDLAKQLFYQLENRKGLDKGKMEQCRMSLFLIECAGARISSENNKEREILNKAYQIVSSQNTQVTSLFKSPFERTILGRLIDFYIYQNKIDSANYYFAKFKKKAESSGKNESGDGTKFLLYSGKVHALNKDFKAAYQDILRAYDMNDSIISIKVSDIHNNLYARLIAEQSNEALTIAEMQKRNQNLIIFTIAMALIIIMFIFARRLSENRKKSDKQIEELNKMTQIQIAELEANANLIQKKMGMELHDDIAGKLINICNYIETQALDEKNTEGQKKFESIAMMARDTYKYTRLKSHEWYFTDSEAEKTVFPERVIKIVDQALPDGKYEKQIEIDDHSLEQVLPEMRIQLLRIIQEAVSNILKHAKASKVKLFIYEEDDLLNLQIIDNGKGFDKDYQTKTKSVGLLSLKNRIKEMNGSLEIVTSPKGTEILCTIPFATKHFDYEIE